MLAGDERLIPRSKRAAGSAGARVSARGDPGYDDRVRARITLLSALAASAFAAGAACAAPGCLLTTFEVGSLPDAGSDAAEEAAAPACGKTYPDPPGGGDMPINNTFVLAIRTVDMGEGEPEPPGYDLDRQCTCTNDAGPTCVMNIQSCDAPDGVDNASAKLVNLITTASGGAFGSASFSAQANNGDWSLLIQISNYNGLDNDPAVDVAMFASPGLPAAAKPAKWDGNDAWTVSATSVTNMDLSMPVYKAAGAYVANRVLVAAIPSVAFTISGGTQQITVKLTAGVFTGTLQPVGLSWRIPDGIIAARWYEPDIFAALSSYRDSNSGPICTDTAVAYATAKATICNNLDILKDGAEAKSLPCDSLSMGLGFKAEPAQLGDVTQPPAPAKSCPADKDPINDHCTP